MNILDLDYPDFAVEVGKGQESFKMKRGSFQYKDRIQSRKPLEVNESTCTLVHLKNRFLFRIEKNSKDINRYWVTFPVGKEEHFYGCGENFSEFDLKGQKVRIWVAEHQNSNRISKKIIRQKLFGVDPNKKLPFSKYESYYVQPTFISSANYYVHVNGTCYMEFDFRKPGYVTIMMRGNCEIEFGVGKDMTHVSELLTERLGRQKALPEWLYDGVILGMQEGTSVVDEKLEKALAHGIPVKGIWCQDWSGCRRTKFGYQVMWNWELDETLYPDLREHILKWKKQDIRFLGYINPFMAIEKELYAYASKKGYCVKNQKGEDYLVTITTFPAAMIDFTNPEAYTWYKGIIQKNMIGIGLGGWMADFGEYLPPDCVLYSKEDPKLLHNQWPAIWARMNYEAIRECGMENEIFFFTRAGFTETIKYSPMMWNGDQHVDWSMDDGLPSVIPATLSLAMSGYGITHSDIGGYTTIMDMTREKELLLRWEEMNAFSPLMRSHEGNQPSRNVQYDSDEELLEQLARMANLHVSIKDYLISCVKEETEYGTPVMRPLFYHYQEEKAYTEKTEYLLGRDMLVAPVIVKGSNSRSVYFPEDSWIHIFTGKVYGAGEQEIEAPIGMPPVFIRASKKEQFEKLFQTIGDK